jgi:hypothetical protein
MRVKVLSLALLAAIVALPVPASQGLAGTFSAPISPATIAPGTGNLGVLLEDPFRVDRLSFAAPARAREIL